MYEFIETTGTETLKNFWWVNEAPEPAAEPAAGGSSSTGKTPKKWESGRTMGKTYGGPGYKWESGRTFGKTYMNDPHYQWTSGRQMGKTGGSDY